MYDLCEFKSFPPVPSISIVVVPAPVIRAPAALSHSATFTISGSIAQFFKTVFPVPKTAAIINVSVPPTDWILKKSSVLCIPEGTEIEYVRSSTKSTTAPIFLYPSINRSIGRVPITQPPGAGNVTLPKRDRSGPVSTTDERIF